MGEHDNVPHVRKVIVEPEPVAPKVKTVKPPRKKVTAQDMDDRFKAAAAKRAQKRADRPERNPGSMARVALGGALGLGILVVGMNLNNAGESHTEAMATTVTQIQSIEGELATGIPSKDLVVAKNLDADLAKARARSDELAAVQREFATIAYGGNAEPPSTNGLPGASTLKALEHGRASVDYFTPASLLLKDDQAYKFTTVDLLGPGRIDPRSSWFVAYDISDAIGKNPASDPASYGWKTASVVPSAAPGVMAVTWINTESTSGNLFAWASAKYDIPTGKFSDFRLNTTTIGDVRGAAFGTTTPAKGVK